MKIVNDSYEILTDLSNPISILKRIESIARTCYKSEDKITDDSCIRFCKSYDKGFNEAHYCLLLY